MTKRRLCENAARSATPEEGLILLVEAHNLWEYLEGIDKRIEEQRELAAGLLADHAKSILRDVDTAIRLEKFSDAERLISQAQALTKQLPGEQPTARFGRLKKKYIKSQTS